MNLVPHHNNRTKSRLATSTLAKGLFVLFLAFSLPFAASSQVANDDCAGAIDLGTLGTPANCGNGPNNNGQGADQVNTGLTNTNAVAENPYSAIIGCQGTGNPDMASPAADVWYSVTVTGNELDITITGLNDPNVGIYSGTCGALTPLGCAVGSGGLLTANFQTIVAGQTIYIQVSGGDENDQGNFNMTLANHVSCDDCILGDALTVNPQPVNGTYQPGQVITFCYQITEFSQENTNWLHGVVPVFGAGWDLSTLAVLPPPTCDNGLGGWFWINNVPTPDGPQSGFWFDGDLFNPPDGDPTNNYGDNCQGNINPNDWNFCWSIEPLDCIQGGDLGISINNYADGETGSWIDVACTGDPSYDFFSTLTCCPEPDTLTVPETCFGACDGSATVDGDANGLGTPPYDYTWTDGGGTQIASQNNLNGPSTQTGLCAGTYTVEVRDANNCIRTIDVTVSAPPQIVLTAGGTPSDCAGTPCNGTLTSTASGGAGGFTYSWDNGIGTGQNQSGVCAGTYIVTVTDANGCTETATFTVTAPPVLVVTATSTDETCDGLCDGTVSANNATGGTPPYTYAWDGGLGGGQNVGGACDGTYTVTVTDANNCTATAQVTVNPGIIVTANFDPVANQCLTGNDFDFTDNSTNATTYAWTFPSGTPGTSTAQNPTGIAWAAAGTYTITLVASNGTCTDTYTQDITVYDEPVITINSTNISCNGVCDGVATANATGGGGGYSYSWDSGAGNSAIASNLCAGTYTVTVTDANNCVGTAQVTITEPPVLAVTATATDASCFGVCDGTLSANNATGGTAPYSYSWDGGVGAGQNQINICAGTYTVTVTDANNCTATATVTINEPPVLVASATATDATCNGVCDGTLGSSATGGTPPLTYAWDGGVGAGQNQTNVCAGTYTVTVTDANGCTSTATVTVNEPPLLAVTATATDEQCNGSCDGSLTASGAGGTGAITYSWDGGIGAGANQSNVCAGTYTVTATDANGCTATATVTINTPPVLTVTIAGNDASCNVVCDGDATATAAGGTGPYTFQWDANGGLGTNASATGLCANTVGVTVTDANGCTATATFVIAEPTPIVLTTSSVNPNCGNADGSATVNISGGTGPYTQSWSPSGGTGTTASNLAAGGYTVTVTDAAGCVETATVTLTDNGAPTATITAQTDVNCFGGNNGSATVTATGGAGGYTYSWSPTNGPSATETGLTAGTYTVTVTDAVGCVATATVTITEPTDLTGAITGQSDPLCVGSCDGTATVTAAGGTPPYNYLWSTGGNTNSESGMCDGNHTVQITDANGCAIIVPVTITDPPVLAGTIVPTDALCAGDCDGSADLTVTGGTPPYTFLWSDASTSEDATGLCAGGYNVTITDANGCTVNVATTIGEPLPLTLATTTTDPTCGQSNGQACVTATDGTPPYTYLWNDTGAQTTACADNIPSGGYQVTVTDANGCTATATVTLSDQAGGTASAVVDQEPQCAGACDGQATVTMAGGTGPFTYLWTPGNLTNATESALCAGTYNIQVTDANLCVTNTTVTLTDPSGMAVTVAGTDPLCNGSCDGSADVTVTGGTPPYTYAWAHGPTAEDLTGVLCDGSYTVTVTDANGCTVVGNVTVTDPPAIVIPAPVTNNVLCNGACDGDATAAPTGGTGALTYDWVNDGTGASVGTTAAVSNLCAGTYTLTVTDANGCTETANITITEPPVITLTTSTVNSNCGQADGEVSVIATGGAGGFTYSWEDGVPTVVGTTATVTGLASGTYTITVTDANGCTETATATIVDNSSGTATAAVDNNVSCNGGCDGQATASMVGGTGPFTFAWSGGGGNAATATGLCAGTYTVDITDANGCLASTTVTITEPLALVLAPTAVDASCNGTSDGEVTVVATDGTGPYTYDWVDQGTGGSVGTSATVTGLPAGTYCVTVTDALGCTDNQCITINEPTPIVVNTAMTDASCGQSDGSVSAAASGGSGTYVSYDWTQGGTPVGSGTTVAGLPAGSYDVLVTDDTGCTGIATVAVGDLAGPTLVIVNTVDVSCNGGIDGSATVNATGGTGAITYDWQPSGGNAATATGLAAGTYTVTATDANGCVDNIVVTINEPTPVVASITGSTDVSGFGLCDGDATASGSGGTAPYTYQWYDDNTYTNTLGTNATQTGLCAQEYCVIITDANGCADSICVTIVEPNAIIINVTPTDALCVGACDGMADVTVSGGVAPYTYQWYAGAQPGTPIGGATGTTVTGLCAGTYYVEVTDDNGIVSNGADFVIGEPTPITATTQVISDYNGQDISCANECDGAAQIIPAGGTPPYTYNWIDIATGNPLGVFTDIANNLCKGTYDIIVTDDNGCVDTFQVTITQPAPLVNVFGSQNVTCPGECDGWISSTPAGGTAPYTYLWSDQNQQTVDSAINLCAGAYNVTITDINGCVLTEGANITEPNAIVLNGSSTGSTCGQADGTATVTIVAGDGPFDYQWDANANNQTTATATNLLAGCYDVVVTDANFCTDTTTICVQDLGAPTLTVLTLTDVSCNGGCDGFAQVQVTGGTPAYTYEWFDANTGLPTNPAINSNNGTNLCAGDYIAQVTDGTGCIATESITINEPTELNPTIQTSTDVTCFGYCDGEATVFVTGATAPYTYLWNDINNQTTATATGLCPGTYSVTVTDAQSCDSTITVTINEPLEILLSTTGTDAFCNTGSGSAYVTVTNGVPPFTYLWDANAGAQSTDTAINLMPGTYTVTVTDINGCVQTATVTIGDIPASVVSIASSTNVSCNGGADGTASSSIGGTGTSPYSYEWFNAVTGLPIGQGGIGVDSATALAAGDYYVVATDVNNCVSISDTVTIIEPTPLTVTTTPTDVSCKNICDGSALATPAGGTAPYQFQWDDGLNQITANASNLCDSTYNVVVTDDNGCTATAPVIIDEPTQLVLDSTVINANCGQADGSGCVLAAGGSGAYTYLWPANAANSTNSCVANLSAGTYLVEVTDANACTEIIPVEISDVSGPAAAIVDSGHVSCFNGNDGFAEVGMVGGQGFFTVLWDANANNQTTPIATNLGAGTYSVTITDSVGCNASTSVVITDPQDITFIISSFDPTCFGSCDGEAWINVVGGTPPYNYQWLDNGGNTISTIDTASALCDGAYQLIITDDNGCTAITNFTITDPALVTATSSGTDVTCFGACDGTATATPGVGVAPFSFQWDDPNAQTTATALGLCPGTYTCTITDDDGCITTVQVTITEPTELVASINTVGNVSCNGLCDGFTQVDVVGGTAPYTYSWNNGALTTQTINNLCAGTYDIVVTDDNGCTSAASITITEPTAMAFTTTTVDVSCFGSCDGEAAINVSGGTAPYTYFWNINGFPTTPSVTGLCAGSYDVTVTDDNGCQITTTVTITQPTLLGMTVSITDANCGQDNGEICITAVGGAAPYTYQWNDLYSQTTSCADSLFQGCYTVVLTDANGCVVDSTICVNDIAGPVITVDNVVNAACNGDANGSIDITVNSGVPPYTITWEDGNNTPMPAFTNLTTANNLVADCYTVTVTDAAGCTFSVVQCITEPAPLTSAIQNSTDVSCNLGCDGTVLVAVNGGTAPYTYVWNGGNNPADAQNTGLCQGTYSVTITDANGCTTSTTVTINQPTALAITSVTTDALCWGDCNGTIDATVTGGTAPYLYNWVPQGIGAGPLVTNLCAGTYVLDITDANGCTEQAQITVNEPDSLQLTPSAIPSTCSQANGAGSVAVVGGTPAYNWLWPNNQTTPNGSGLPAGTHNVLVTDDNGCTSSVAVVVTDQPSPVIDSIVWVAPTCNGLANGSAIVYHSGGTGTITYLWDDPAGQVSQTAIALLAGNYCVTITDANGCQATQCITITEPNPLIPVPSTGVTICYGDSAQIWANAQGGTPPYTINWQGGLGFTGQGPITVIPTFTTDYCFTVTDANGCVSPSGCVTIVVNPPLSLDLTDAFSICDGEDTTLVAVATGGNGGPYTFTWHEGSFPGTILTGVDNGNQSDLAVNVSGDVWYYVVLDDGCSLPVIDSVLVSMNALPIGFLNVVDSAGCAPFTAQFTANSDIGVQYDWDFQCDGTVDLFGTNSSPDWTYTDPGVYDVCVTITSAAGCATTITEPAFVEVYPVPVAGFIMDPQTTTILNPTITFTDISGGGTIYDWDFGDSWNINGPDGPVPLGTNGDLTSGSYSNPVHTYLDTGAFTVTQTVTNAYGCSAVYTDEIIIEGDYILFTPNAFTPDGDGVNDFFFPQGVGIDPNNFEMFIFNRWGELIFESYDPNNWWDGTAKGQEVQIDVYVWLIRTRDHKGNDHEYIGHVTVVR